MTQSDQDGIYLTRVVVVCVGTVLVSFFIALYAIYGIGA
jgi:hypothetical protein